MQTHLTYAACLVALASARAAAEPTSGVDGALFRSSYDTNGIYSLEGARLLPKGDLAFRVLLGIGRTPLKAAVPGIGAGAGDTGDDRVLDYLATLDMAFGMSLGERIALGLDVSAYRTSFGAGYGKRGRYGLGGAITTKSSGVVALRPLSNLDPSASPNDSAAYLGDQVAGPLDARFGLKLALLADSQLALTLVGSVFLPFGDDEALLGDRNLVFEPKLAFEWRPDRIRQTRIVANAGARIRQRAVLQGYDTQDAAATPAMAKVFVDIGSEAVVGAGAIYELSPRASVGVEATAFIPLPDGASWGDCRLYSGFSCDTLQSSDYFAGAKHGDFTTMFVAGAAYQVSPDVALSAMVGTGQLGVRGDDIRVTTGILWAPQPAGASRTRSGNDRDGDGVPDSVDACPDDAEDKDGFQDEDGCPDPDNDGDGIPDVNDGCPNEPEDKDGFQDGDGCPEPDNDNDGIPDALDRCPNEPEDKDGFEDEDGCPDDDNDGDGFADKVDKCPNDPETVNGFEDDDGCPDVRGTSGPEERADRIELRGQPIAFARGALTPQSRQLLAQVAALIKIRRLAIRVEAHVALGTRSNNPAQINAQKRRDRQVSQQRARLVSDYLASQGVTQLQAVGYGSDRPVAASATDPANERVELIKQQGGTQ